MDHSSGLVFRRPQATLTADLWSIFAPPFSRGLSQAQLATLVGAARKAVVYQWEARKRTPSPVFWQRLTTLFTTAASP